MTVQRSQRNNLNILHFVVLAGGKWLIAPCGDLKSSYLDKDGILHKMNNIITRLTCIMNIYILIFSAGPPRGEILTKQTDRQTDKVTTVTLTAHARQGFKILHLQGGFVWLEPPPMISYFMYITVDLPFYNCNSYEISIAGMRSLLAPKSFAQYILGRGGQCWSYIMRMHM